MAIDQRVIVPHRAIIEPPRKGNLILGFAELGLQLQKLLIGFQVRIGFGQRKQARQSLTDRAFGGLTTCALIDPSAHKRSAPGPPLR